MSTHLIPEGKKTMQSILKLHDPKVINKLTGINVSRIKDVLEGQPATGSESHRLTAAARALDYERPGSMDLKEVEYQYRLLRGTG